MKQAKFIETQIIIIIKDNASMFKEKLSYREIK